MSDILRSVGLDVGTTSTQMIFSELTVENKASGFAVPEMEIARRDIRYRSPVYFTPLLDESHVDAEALRELVAEEYRKAGIRRESVDTGAIIITGETSRKENARAVLDALSDFAGEFVVATAGPDLESVLAAKGAGAVDYSQRTGKTVLHMDIGGGTSNLALIRDGKIERTGCLNVGGRLLKFDGGGTVTYVSPVLDGLCDLKPGDKASPGQVKTVAEILTQALEMAAGLREETPLLEQLTTREAGRFDPCREKELVISFSGGVADCIEKELPWLEFGDIGPILGQTIRESRLCGGGIYPGKRDHPRHGHRRGLPQRPAVRKHRVPSERPVPAEERPGGVTDGHFPGGHPPGAEQAGGQRHSGVSGDKFPGLPGGGGDGGGNRGGHGRKSADLSGTGHGQGTGTGAGASSRPQRGNPVHRPGEGERRQLSGRGCPGGASPTGGGKDSGSRKIEGRGI